MKVLVSLNPDTLHSVREILEDVLSVEQEEMASQNANFYHDLGGESIDVLDLSFHVEKRFGIKLNVKEFLDRVTTIPKEQPLESINETLRSEFLIVKGIELEPSDLIDIKGLMTIGFIAYIIDFERANRRL
jgi:acyl carrier protein